MCVSHRIISSAKLITSFVLPKHTSPTVSQLLIYYLLIKQKTLFHFNLALGPQISYASLNLANASFYFSPSSTLEIDSRRLRSAAATPSSSYHVSQSEQMKSIIPPLPPFLSHSHLGVIN